MRYCLLLLVIALVVDPEKPVTLPEGQWDVVQLNTSGDKLNPKTFFGGITVEINKDTLRFKFGKREVVHKIMVDASKTPAFIDMHPQDPMFKDRILKGIFKLEEGTLYLATDAQGGQERPKDFSQPARNSGYNLFVLKKQP